MIGQVIGNYKIETKLGEGGMGAVYKGVDTMLDREVAIKALRPELASQTSVVERFRSEAVTLAKLHHPNIATLYSLFRHGDELYMVLEYVRGETLDQILARRGALSADEVIPVFAQILDGINHAHEFGIVHRDIKPANMMLTERGTLKVLDFGIARLLGTNRMTRAGSIIGTLEYMAPEQVKGLETDARTDIYALGMMLYEMLTGRPPFETENEFHLMMLQIDHLPPPPGSINPSIPPAVEAAIMRAVQKNPEERFQTAAEFREALLGAGFATQGAILRRGNTGDHQSQQPTAHLPASHSTGAPVSKPGSQDSTAALPPPHQQQQQPPPPPQNAIKETRLGAPAAAASVGVASAASLFAPAAPVKETRLGGAPLPTSAAPSAATGETAAAAFFNKLTWVHYAGASFAGVMVLGLLVIVPVFILSAGGGGKANTSDTSEPRSANTGAGNAGPKAPPPQPTQQPPSSSAPSSVAEERPAAAETPSYLPPPTPVPGSSETSPPASRSGSTARSTPRPKATRKPGKRPGGGDPTCDLTGDC